MKNKQFFSLMAIALMVISLGFSACDKDEDESKPSAYVKITVKKSSEVQSGVTVCMFEASSGPSTEFFTEFYAKKKVVTDANGVATFNLQETFDLNVIDSQTTLYFAVFDGKTLLGKTAVTVEKGQTKTGTINY